MEHWPRLEAAPRWALGVEHRNWYVMFGCLIFLIQPEILLGMEAVTPLDVNFLSRKMICFSLIWTYNFLTSIMLF